MKKSILLVIAMAVVGCQTKPTITQEKLWPKGVPAGMREIADNFPSSDPVQERERVRRIADKEAKKAAEKKGFPTMEDMSNLIDVLIPLLTK
tara:strand:+ start:277 stop:552 length:276 start_codon:yes stop_codon:yes gene_type:complete